MKAVKLSIFIIFGFLHAPLLSANAPQKVTGSFYFYGNLIYVDYNPEIGKIYLPEKALTKKELEEVMQVLEKDGLNTTIDQLYIRSKEFSLDGLGFLQMLKKFTQYVFPSASFSLKKSIVWYGLRHKNFDAVLLGNEDYFNLFIQTDYEADSGFRITLDGKQYISATNEKLHSSRISVFDLKIFKDSSKNTVDFNPFNTPKLGSATEQKTRTFEYNNQTFIFNGVYNKNLVDYLNELPSFKIGSYMYVFEPSEEAAKSIDDSMQVWLTNKGYKEKLDFLLKFVQEAFPYKADNAYRKREKRNFVEQTIADDFTDCEDKAAMFCYLAQKYLYVETILLYSRQKIHVNCAIELPANSPGYTFKRNGKAYMICEPAFRGFKAGETNLTNAEILNLQMYE